MKRPILFVDMDGTIADFEVGIERRISINKKPKECLQKGFYRNLPVIKGAKKAINELEKHYDVYIASKPKKENPWCLEEKMEWVREHFSGLSKKVFFTPDKTLLRGDILIDDNERWSDFGGRFILFNKDQKNWDTLSQKLLEIKASD